MCIRDRSLYDGTTIISPLEQTTKGTYKENPQSGIVITVSSNTAHQIDPDTGAAIVEVEQKNDEQVGSLLLTKKGEQLTEVTEMCIRDRFQCCPCKNRRGWWEAGVSRK